MEPITTTAEQAVLRLATYLLDLSCPHPLRAAIDGVDAAGKTTLAGALAARMKTSGRQIIRASIDGFHRPRAERYRRGPDSPEGYYADSFDLPALRRLLLDPLGRPAESIVYTKIFDHRSDSPDPAHPVTAGQNSILLFDGVFLQRPELRGCWDCVIFVQVSFDTVLERAGRRDAASMGGALAVRERYLRRYIPAQQRYLDECRPAERADIIVRNDDPLCPEILFHSKFQET